MKKSNIRKLFQKDSINSVSVFSLLSGFFSVGIVLYYIFCISRGYYHADCTDTITWAEATLDSGSLMNQEFYYACLLPFGGQLLMVPFVAIFGFGMKAQLLGMALFAVLFALALVYLCRAMNFSYKWCSVAVSILFIILSASDKLREIFWCHIIYYSLGLLFLMVGLALVINILKNETAKKRHYILFFIWTVLCSMNGVQALTIYCLPVLAAVVAESFFDLKTPLLHKNNLKKYIIVFSMLVAIVMGIIFAQYVNGDIIAGYEMGYSGFSDKSRWMDNFLSILPQLFTLFGVTTTTETLIYSPDGIIALLKIICVFVLLIVPVIMMFMYRKFEELSYRLMILVHAFLSTLLMTAWIFGTLNTACWRLSPMLATATILCVMFVRWLYKNKQLARLMAIIIVPVSIVMIIISLEIYTKDIEGQTEENRRLESLCEFLEENELEYGYATFWDANSITLLSDSKVKVRCIRIDAGIISPRLYQTNINWYKDNSYDSYFLLLTPQEYLQYISSNDYERPKKLLEYEKSYILVYDYNIVEIK